MNKKRLSRIKGVISKIDEINDEIEDILSDEEDAFDNMPEGLQYSLNGERSEAAIDALSESTELVTDAKDTLENVREILEGIE